MEVRHLISMGSYNIQQDEKARLRKHDNTYLQVKGHALQSKSNKRDMGSPADYCSQTNEQTHFGLKPKGLNSPIN